MRTKELTALAAAALAIAVLAGVSQAAAAPVKSEQARIATSYLFVFEGETAQMAPITGRAGAYTFTMPIRSAKHRVTWFTDRPARDAGALPMKSFVALWSRPGADSFAADPPNVAINYTSGGGDRTFIATMSSPRIVQSAATPGTPSLRATMTAVPRDAVTALEGSNGVLAKHAKRAQTAGSATAARRWFRTSATLTNASVVVDNFSGSSPSDGNCFDFPTDSYWASFTSFSDYASAYDYCFMRAGGGPVANGAIPNVPLPGLSFPSTAVWLGVTCASLPGMPALPVWTPGSPQPSTWIAYATPCTTVIGATWWKMWVDASGNKAWY